MKLKPLSIALAALLMAGASASWAATTSDFILDDDDDDEEDGVIELSDTYVRPELTDIERLRRTKEVIVIDAKQMQGKGNREVTDVLKKLPSVTVSSSGKKQIDIRGQGYGNAARNIVVQVDGAPVTSLATHPFSRDMNIIPVEQLESIEIIPGGGSVIYGSGAQGGVINMTSSLHSMKKPRKMVSAQYGTDGHRATAALGHAFLDNKLAIEATATKSKQDLEFDDTYDKSEYYGLGARLELPGSQRLIMRLSHYESDSQYIYSINADRLRKYGRKARPLSVMRTIGHTPDGKPIKKRVEKYNIGDRKLDTVALTHVWTPSEQVKLTTDVFHLKGFNLGDDFEKHRADTKDFGIKPKLDWDYSENGHLLVGIDLTHQESDLEYQDFGAKTKQMRYFYKKDNAALFFVNTNTWNGFEFTEGIRRDRTIWKNSIVDRDVPFEPRSTRWNTAWSLAAAYNYSETGRVHARYERGFTGMDGMSVSDQIVVKDNQGGYKKVLVPTEAKDEKFDIAEIGWNDAFDWTTVSVTAWMSHTPNQTTRPEYWEHGKQVRKTRNTLNVKRRGIDLKFNQSFGPVELEEGYSYMYGKSRLNLFPDDVPPEKLNSSVHKADGLLTVPRHKIAVTTRLKLRHDLSIEGTYICQAKFKTPYKNGKEDEFVKGFWTFDLALNWEPTPHITVSAGVTNAFDKLYYVYGSGNNVVPSPERAFFAGLKATF